MKFTKGIFASFLVFAFVFAAASTASAYTHMGMLKMGSTGSQVMELQKALNGNGFLISTTGAGSPGMESSYFGAKTKSAVMAFQSAKGLTPVDGIVGINTGTALGALTTTGGGVTYPAGCTAGSMFSTTTGQPCTATTTTVPGCAPGAMFSSTTGASCTGGSTPSTNGPLAGTDGSINDVNEISSYNNEEVGEGQDDVKVLGFEVEATNDGDIAIKSAKVSVTITNASGSDNLDDYVDSVSVWMGSTKVGSADAGDFSEGSSGVWTKTVTLSNPVVRADDTEKFYISVDAVGSLDSGDIASEVATFDVDNLRFADGSGVVTTEDGYDLGAMDVVANFVSFSTSADIELVISTASDSPEAGVVMVDDSTSTDDVVLLKGKLKLEGDSDVNIDEFPVSFSPVGANIDVMVESLKLVIDGEEYTESVPSIADAATGSVTFDNLDFDLSAGDTVTFEVRADMTDMDGTIFAEGDTLEANVTSDNRDVMDAENEEGDPLSDSSEKSGTANGDAQEFRTEGISLTLVSTSSTVTAGQSANDDLGEFIIKFKIKANGSSVYVSSLAAASLTTGNTGFSSGVERSGTATIGGVSTTIVNTTDDDLTAVGNYLIEDGDEETFEMTTTVQLPTAGAAGQFRALLRGLDWDIDDDATPDSTYTSNLDSFKTSYKALN